MKDLGNNYITGKLYRIIYLLNCNTEIRVRNAFGRTNTKEAGETVRQVAYWGAVISANSMNSLKETADQERATTNVRKAELGPLCFQDNVAAVSNKK